MGQPTVDILICCGEVPEHLDKTLIRSDWMEGRLQQMLLKINGIANYWITDGAKIIVCPYKDASSDDIRLYLLGSAMGAILHQRGMLPFHGSSICVQGKAITFSGPSGIGKSTLTAALVSRGYRMMADDVSAISFDNEGVPMVNPGMPQLKLREDAGRKLGRNMSRARPLGNHAGKYGHPEHIAFVVDALPSKAIYILGRHTANKFENILLKGMDKFQALQINTYRPLFVKALGIELIHFDQLKKLAGNIDVYLLLRPTDGFRIDELADYVSQLVTQ